MLLFEITSICSGGGYKYCRTNPLHPKANSNGLYPLHRVLMENKIGRLLTKGEIVHHKNGIKNDNRIENLEKLMNSQHAKLHRPEMKSIKIKCYECNKIFYLKAHVRRQRLKRSKDKNLFCSLSCGATHQFKK